MKSQAERRWVLLPLLHVGKASFQTVARHLGSSGDPVLKLCLLELTAEAQEGAALV